ncbi:UPF0764 protein C16orf89 homolog [Bradysia coprophila]|uniref:UPF0764 protein C16orf89 homolog n=1 Tax=Bradysia coprophila TaxID=38358 RepID=UPI00187DD538|nr:UPF0764 protein C16orf89 homolog [Bradysia coprophila]
MTKLKQQTALTWLSISDHLLMVAFLVHSKIARYRTIASIFCGRSRIRELCDCFSGEKRTVYESQNLVDPTKFLETMCRRVITETKFIETLNYPITQQDLFVEQILVCFLAGYNDFLTNKWTNVVLDWSGENGLLGCYSLESINAQKQSLSRRVKRWDKLYEDGNTCAPFIWEH